MEILLGIATILGGVTAIWFLWEKICTFFTKYFKNQNNKDNISVKNIDTENDKQLSAEIINSIKSLNHGEPKRKVLSLIEEIARTLENHPNLQELREKKNVLLTTIEDINNKLKNLPTIPSIGEMKEMHDVEISAEFNMRKNFQERLNQDKELIIQQISIIEEHIVEEEHHLRMLLNEENQTYEKG